MLKLHRSHHDRRGGRPAPILPARDTPPALGPTLQDRCRQPAGSFVGRVDPDDPVGSFGNVPYRRRTGAGTFAGDPDRQRKGSFGDHDLEHAPSTRPRAAKSR